MHSPVQLLLSCKLKDHKWIGMANNISKSLPSNNFGKQTTSVQLPYGVSVRPARAAAVSQELTD